MKTLYPAQESTFQHFASYPGNTLDASDVGTGKTVVAGKLAKQWPGPVAVLCPKSVIPSWERALDEEGVNPLFVLNYEQIRGGKRKNILTKVGKKTMTWHLPPGTLMLVDECHKFGSPWSQISQMLIALVDQGFRVHGMSATAAENPTQMRALGYMLGLHGLNKSSPAKPGWIRWMEGLGCRQDVWGGWCFTGKPERLVPLHRALFGVNGPARRLTAADFPDSFRENRVFIEPIEFGAAKEIKQVYEDCGLTPEILIRFIELGTVTDSQHVLANIIRALQLAEALKVPELVVMAKDLLEQGFSVPIFLNFRESSHALAQLLGGVPVIDGLTTGDGRQDIIDRFQADEEYCVILNSNAGGTGISLHDLHGNRQRVSLISPTFSVKTHMQVLGRTHRNGAKSDSVQKVLVAAGTLEEEVMEAVLRKAANLKMIHDGN